MSVLFLSLSCSVSLSVYRVCLCLSKQALQNPDKAELMKHDLTAGALISKETQNKLATKTHPIYFPALSEALILVPKINYADPQQAEKNNYKAAS